MGISLFAPQLYSFMGPETANIKRIFMWFSRFSGGKSHENAINLGHENPLKNH